MSGKRRISGVLTNNGMTSFVPPCYSWEVRDSYGHLVESFSDVVLMGEGGASNVTLDDPYRFIGLAIEGYADEYATPLAAGHPSVTGRRLILTKAGTAQ